MADGAQQEHDQTGDVFPYANPPDIHAFCLARLEASQREGDEEAPSLRGRLEIAVHVLRALGPETWGQAEDDIREIAARFVTHPKYAALGFSLNE